MRVITPSPRYQLKLYLIYLTCFAVFVFPWTFLGLVPDLGLWYVLIFMLANTLWLAPVLALIPAYCRRLSYTVDGHEITVRKGLITQVVQTVPLSKVTNLALNRGPFDRLLGLGTLQVHTAGFSQNQGPEAALVGLENYAEVQQVLLAQVRAIGVTVSPTDEGVGTSGTAPETHQLLTEILAELRGIRQTLEE